MSSIKRLNYFTYQFLVEKDFKDEQAYHLGMRRRHNSSLHSWGVAEGLDVEKVVTEGKTVTINPGMAIDELGREIVISDTPTTYPLVTSVADGDVYVTISYAEVSDEDDAYTSEALPGKMYTRVTEQPILATVNNDPNDGTNIMLAKITLASGIITSVDMTGRKTAGTAITPGSVGTAALQDNAVTAAKLQSDVANDGNRAVTTNHLQDNAVISAKLQDNAVTSAKLQSDPANNANRAVRTDHIRDGAVTEAKLEPGVRSRLVDLSRIHKVPLLQQTIFKRGYLAATVSLPAGSNPRGVAFDGTNIWVSNFSNNTVSKIDINSNTVAATVNLPAGSGPADGIAFDGTSLWVANNTSGTVSKINITSNAVDTVVVGTSPYGIAFDGSFIWVVNYGSGTVSKIKITDNTITATVTVGTNPFGIAFDGTYMWVGDSGTPVKAHKIDIQTNQVAATVQLAQSTSVQEGGGTRGVVFDGTHVWVAQLEGWVNKIDVASNTLVARFQAATKGFGLAFDGTHIWMNGGATVNTITKIDINSNTPVATLTVGTNVRNYCSAFDGTYLWVPVYGDDKVVKIKKMI